MSKLPILRKRSVPSLEPFYNSPISWRTARNLELPRFTSTEPSRRSGRRSSERKAKAGRSTISVSQIIWPTRATAMVQSSSHF
jgi:hypothetical protein